MMEDKARQKAFHKQLIEFNPATLPPPDPPTLLPRIPTLPQSSLPSCRPSVVRSAVVVLTHAPLAPGPLPSPRVLCVSSLLRGMSDGGWGGAGRGWAGRQESESYREHMANEKAAMQHQRQLGHAKRVGPAGLMGEAFGQLRQSAEVAAAEAAAEAATDNSTSANDDDDEGSMRSAKAPSLAAADTAAAPAPPPATTPPPQVSWANGPYMAEAIKEDAYRSRKFHEQVRPSPRGRTRCSVCCGPRACAPRLART